MPRASDTAWWALTGWACGVGAGLLPRSEMLLHPSVAFLPSVFPMLSPSGLSHMFFLCLGGKLNPSWEHDVGNKSV